MYDVSNAMTLSSNTFHLFVLYCDVVLLHSDENYHNFSQLPWVLNGLGVLYFCGGHEIWHGGVISHDASPLDYVLFDLVSQRPM